MRWSSGALAVARLATASAASKLRKASSHRRLRGAAASDEPCSEQQLSWQLDQGGATGEAEGIRRRRGPRLMRWRCVTRVLIPAGMAVASVAVVGHRSLVHGLVPGCQDHHRRHHHHLGEPHHLYCDRCQRSPPAERAPSRRCRVMVHSLTVELVTRQQAPTTYVVRSLVTIDVAHAMG